LKDVGLSRGQQRYRYFVNLVGFLDRDLRAASL
jgi:hypothetical protein